MRKKKRLRLKPRYKRILKSMLVVLITISALAILMTTFQVKVLQINGTSMNPTLAEDEIVVTAKTSNIETGDIIAFYYNNKILVKRVIAQSEDTIDIDKEGTVSVNGEMIDESYLTEKTYGNTNVELPYQVPDERIFVMGDNRSDSVDSRNTTIGSISKNQIIGKILFRIWPLSRINIFR